MLIEFSVKNFKSIRETQTLSMIANNKDKQLPGNLIDVDIPGMSNAKLLKSAAIYGANASGKSNLCKAAEFMRKYVVNSATEIKPGQETGVTPFKLDRTSPTEPSEFEIIFIHEGVRYQYGFSMDNKRIHEEWLIAYPQKQPQRWFNRNWNPDRNEYEWKFGSKLLGDKESLKIKTKDNSLFLSTAAQFNHEQLLQILSWFSTIVSFIFSENIQNIINFSSFFLYINKHWHKEAVNLIKKADFGISDIVFKSDSVETNDHTQNTPATPELEFIKEIGVVNFNLIHKKIDNKDTIPFDNDEESSGTLKYYSLLGPLLIGIKLRFTFIIDEIGAQLHPHLVRNLVKMINDPNINAKGAQLILTTHDTTLLDTSLFRRDQIWFTEKNKAGATTLYPLTDFKPRANEALQKGYLAGRYGAIPYIGEFPF